MFTVSKSGDLSGVAKELQRSAIAGQKAAGRAVAKDGRKLILDDVRTSRGTLRMMGGNLNVKTRTKASAVSSTVELYGTPAGPWTIVTKGTRAYEIRVKRAKVLSSGSRTYGTRVDRSARRGRPYWTNATDRLDSHLFPVVKGIVDAEMGV